MDSCDSKSEKNRRGYYIDRRLQKTDNGKCRVEEDIFTYRKLSGYSFRGFKKKSGNAGICRRIQ